MMEDDKKTVQLTRKAYNLIDNWQRQYRSKTLPQAVIDFWIHYCEVVKRLRWSIKDLDALNQTQAKAILERNFKGLVKLK